MSAVDAMYLSQFAEPDGTLDDEYLREFEARDCGGRDCGECDACIDEGDHMYDTATGA